MSSVARRVIGRPASFGNQGQIQHLYRTPIAQAAEQPVSNGPATAQAVVHWSISQEHEVSVNNGVGMNGNIGVHHGSGGLVGQEPIVRRTALFVDFENVYIGLRNASPEAARRFATNPARWVRWMEQDLGPLLVDDNERPRALLRRICYLDPAASRQYRPYFTRAGFRVVDCPALTAMGKNSADIHMVLDIVDTLGHPTWFDEFIVLSADADFTPVLLRLREHDRRTAMLVNGPTAAALQAACDFAIPDTMFIEEALGLSESALDEAAGVPQPARQPLPTALTAAGQTSAAFTTAGQTSMPAPFTAGPTSMPAAFTGAGPATVAGPPAPTRPMSQTADSSTASLRTRMEQVVRDLVATSPAPVDMATAAHAVRRALGGTAATNQWAGAGTFKQFIATIVDSTLVMDAIQPGWLRDPRRHDPVSDAKAVALGAPEVADRVHRVVGAPLLSASAYGTLFAAIAAQGSADPNQPATEAERAIRTHCTARGHAVSRQAIHFVLSGLQHSRVAWQTSEATPAYLASEFAKNVVRLAANAQMDLSDEESEQILHWIAGSATGGQEH